VPTGTSSWTLDDASDLYGLDRWGNDYFGLNEEGEVTVKLRDQSTGKEVPISLPKVIEGMTERGFAMPLNLRFRDLLDRRIEHLNGAFQKAIEEVNYQGKYRGVYPIKVNQQQQVVEEISNFGNKFNYGLECGSKPELLTALAYQHNPEALIICNGYKDTEFIDLWADSGGDRSVFGLNTTQVIDTIDTLKKHGFLHNLRLFHFHQGSQLPNIRSIREAASEATRVYVSLVHEGAPMGLLDLGGGLAIDYDGSKSSNGSSSNYSLDEYATDLIETVLETCALTECFNDALFYRDKIRALFTLGTLNLRDRAYGERAYWHIITLISQQLKLLERVPEDLAQIEENLTDYYYANFSVFQSLPDAWAIEQLFPIMPLHRHQEEPTRPSIIADITCDCDGKIAKFINQESTSNHLLLHPFDSSQEKPYYIGAFLTGAYQETLGDLHNLLGDPNVVSVSVENGEICLTHEVEGDTVADVLSYVEYNPKNLEARFRNFAEQAVKKGKITPAQRKETMQAFRETLNGYTYYED